MYPVLLRNALMQLASSDDWPQCLIFVGLIPNDLIAMGCRRLMHGDLLTGLRAHVERKSLDWLESRNDEVFDGDVEMESDGVLILRSMSGKPLPAEIENDVLRLIEKCHPS